MCAVSPEGHALTDRFYFEFKSYKNLDIPQFFLKGTGILANFWRSTVQEALFYSKNPILIARQNRLPTMLICLEGDRSVLNVVRGGVPMCFNISPLEGWDTYQVFLLDDVLASEFGLGTVRERF
jgi:hypothetical protein